ncbi:hypothetical protein IYX23_02380 [Methylocystis sp. L43]|uniref:hypothetical protein n=1 Tax=unclassified Methylocystis TaxID=2625913 RepID=UPI0018C33E56|nr:MULTISPECIES: hypothetical protein [unclassified Methylocystis]MBG0796546.1 hypothetical protein [Methylocystis sp. L43]MBG0804493.1 hypothetical protein [Methylocystis sp. H15]
MPPLLVWIVTGVLIVIGPPCPTEKVGAEIAGAPTSRRRRPLDLGHNPSRPNPVARGAQISIKHD